MPFVLMTGETVLKSSVGFIVMFHIV